MGRTGVLGLGRSTRAAFGWKSSIRSKPASARRVQVRAVVLPLPPQEHYTSCSRNSIRSRAWGAKLEGCSYKVRAEDTCSCDLLSLTWSINIPYATHALVLS